MIGHGNGHGESTCWKQRMRFPFSSLATIPNVDWSEAMGKEISSSTLLLQLSRAISGTKWSGHNSDSLIWGSSIIWEWKAVLVRAYTQEIYKSLHQRAQEVVFRAAGESRYSLLIISIFRKGSSEFQASMKIPHLVWVKVDNWWFYCWPFNCAGEFRMQFPHQSPDSSCLPLGSRDLLLITKEESEIHCLLWISFPFGPKAEAARKNTRSTNHCKSTADGWNKYLHCTLSLATM